MLVFWKDEQNLQTSSQAHQEEKREVPNKIIEKGEITTNTTEIQKIIRKYYEQLYASKLDNLEEMEKFLETYSLPKLSQEETDNLNSWITRSEKEFVIRKTSYKEKSRTR